MRTYPKMGSDSLSDAINIFFLVFAGLFPIVNPVGNAPIFYNFTRGCQPATRRMLARRIALGGFLLLLGSLFIGSHVLVFFGITLPVVRIAGGLVVTSMGWNLLNAGETPIESQSTPGVGDQTALERSFYPLTMPLTVGPGSIATAITLGSQKGIAASGFGYLALQGAAAIVGLCAVSLTIYLSYRYADKIEQFLGKTGTSVLIRLSAFILLCIGVQILWNGVSELFKLSY